MTRVLLLLTLLWLGWPAASAWAAPCHGEERRPAQLSIATETAPSTAMAALDTQGTPDEPGEPADRADRGCDCGCSGACVGHCGAAHGLPALAPAALPLPATVLSEGAPRSLLDRAHRHRLLRPPALG